MNKTIYFVVGPTGIGKSALALKLAKKLNGQIINADSMQVYKELKVLTARPNLKDTTEVQHHLYGHINCTERYNVAKWCKEASELIIKSNKNDVASIVVGGTGMYIDKLLNGITDIPPSTEIIKKESEKILHKDGIINFYNKVKVIDPDSLINVDPNDTIRIRRIWEVYHHTGTKMSLLKKNPSKIFLKKNQKYIILLFLPDRQRNYQRVNQRFVNMFKNGAVQEVERLLKFKLKNNLPVMKAHGVPEISLFLKN